MRARAIMYHDVVENGDFASSGFPGEGAHVYKLRREDFERHLDAIGAREVALTFDDGGVSFLHPIADLLEARGRRGCFFITTGRIGTPGFLSEEEVRELHRRGHSSAATPPRTPRAWRHLPARNSIANGAPACSTSPTYSTNP